MVTQWRGVIYLTRQLGGREVLDSVEDGRGGDEQQPLGQHPLILWEI